MIRSQSGQAKTFWMVEQQNLIQGSAYLKHQIPTNLDTFKCVVEDETQNMIKLTSHFQVHSSH